MLTVHRLAGAIALGMALAPAPGPAAPLPPAEVIHWWTSGGESAAVRVMADAYRAAGGTWQDSPVAGSEQARAVAINRIVGRKAPAAAQFNTSRQFRDMIDAAMLENVDALAAREHWDQTLPEPIRDVIRQDGHYYAVPVDFHSPGWIWYSKAAFRKAGIAREPANMDELFAALDKLKAAGLIALAHGGQSWQENIVFMTVLANVGGKDLYLKVLRERDPRAIQSDAFLQVLLAFKRLSTYVDRGAPGRNWNDASALLISGRAGVQIMGDWVKAEFGAARLSPGKDYGCLPGFGARAPYLIQGDAFVFPRRGNADMARAQQLLGQVMVAPATQLAFNRLKGSLPVRPDVDVSTLDACAQLGWAALKDRSRHVGIGEVYLTPDQNGALADALTAYWNREQPVAQVQKAIAAALRY
ncbi:ABC transporter substrate-binding protein [Massilia sp. TS11]|uniref:ABC transporter substrate-binding protein n=1 Tax=Massilia sp. TS11 TaxID=2908003 RepID=UPI001EDB4B1E|nr:ABC transporter substrate-binding protein [Massilia sp. TS11]MCG2586758.1 ABC transporter substrate-binding protein [Massilia sp. TS11]